MRFITTLTRALLAGLFILAVSTGAHAAGKEGVVIQVSDKDPAKWNLALNNAKNVQQELGKDKVDIEIVAYGPGLDMLKFESEAGPRIAEAIKSGVKVSACGNTMKAQKVSEKDLLTGVSVVPAGVVEIMQKQKAGWAYVRP